MTARARKTAEEIVDGIDALLAGGGTFTDEQRREYAVALVLSALRTTRAEERERCARLVEDGAFELRTVGYLNGPRFEICREDIVHAIRALAEEDK